MCLKYTYLVFGGYLYQQFLCYVSITWEYNFFLLNTASTPKQKNEISGIKVELAGGGTLRSVLVAQQGEKNHL